MTISVASNAGPLGEPETLRRLTAFLSDPLDLDGPLAVRLLSGGRSNPTYELTDGTRWWILRRPPHGLVLPTAHDMAREARVMKALAASDVPVPHVVVVGDDAEVIGAPFYVMDRVDGVTIRRPEQLADDGPATRRRLAEEFVGTFARLHQIDPAEIGLSDFGRPEGFLERQIRRWGAQWRAVQTRERPIVDVLLARLASSVPQSGLPGLVHGDVKLDNVMVDADDHGRLLAVLDWEMSTLGDTLADVGLMASFWDQAGEQPNPITAGVTALEGFPTRAEMIELYRGLRGADLPDLDWYLVFADVKVAIILEQIHARHLGGHTEGQNFAEVAAMVDPLFERGLETASRSDHPGLRA